MLAALMLPYSVVNWLALSPYVLLQHGAQVFQVQQQQAVVVGDLEYQLQHPGLGVVEVQHAGQQQGPHVRHRSAHRVALFAEHVPQRGGAGRRNGAGSNRAPPGWLPAFLGRRPSQLGKCPSGRPLMSAMKDRHARLDRFSARVCNVMVLPVPVAPGDQSVAVGQAGKGGIRCRHDGRSGWGLPWIRGSRQSKGKIQYPCNLTIPEHRIMAGHSKWANIQHRKGRQDEKRGKVWTRITREIIVAARAGRGDINMNPRLRLAIDKAKAANMPADNIKRNVDKATGNLDGASPTKKSATKATALVARPSSSTA